jgi:hypothetical protein
MKQYLLSVYQPDGPVPAADVLEPIMKNLARWNDELRASDAWVFSAGLHPPESATVLRADGDEVLLTDGPFTEGKEHLGGFTIVQADDLDEALGWARKLAVIVNPLSIEVRPFAG